jgi:hypothetical protein
VQWSWFNNETEQKSLLPGETTFALPKPLLEGSSNNYFAADIHDANSGQAVTVYVRKGTNGIEVVGVNRMWMPA